MSEESMVQEGVLVAAFAEEGAAGEALENLKKAKKEKTFDFWDAAVIRVDERGHYYYDETRDRSAAQGGGIGAIVGGLLGAPFGPAGLVIGAGLGASLGAFATNSDAGLKDDNIERVGQELKSGNSALLIVPDRANLSQMQEYAAEEEVEAAIQKLTAGIADNMEHGQSVVYHVTAAGRSVSCHQLEADNTLVMMLGI